jgi:hypothetical protein
MYICVLHFRSGMENNCSYILNWKVLSIRTLFHLSIVLWRLRLLKDVNYYYSYCGLSVDVRACIVLNILTFICSLRLWFICQNPSKPGFQLQWNWVCYYLYFNIYGVYKTSEGGNIFMNIIFICRVFFLFFFFLKLYVSFSKFLKQLYRCWIFLSTTVMVNT